MSLELLLLIGITTLVVCVAAIVVDQRSAGRQRSNEAAIERKITSVSRKLVDGPDVVVDFFHVNMVRLNGVYEQFGPAPSSRTVESSETRNVEGGAELHGFGGRGGRQRTTSDRAEFGPAEGRAGAMISSISRSLDESNQILIVDLTKDAPFSRFRKKLQVAARQAGFQVSEKTLEILRTEWSEQARHHVTELQAARIQDLRGFISIRSEFEVSELRDSGGEITQLNLRTSLKILGGTEDGIEVRVTAVGQIYDSQVASGEGGPMLRNATCVGSVVGASGDSRIVEISAIYCYWS